MLRDVSADGSRIIPWRCEHTPAISKFDRHRTGRNWQDVLQDDGIGTAFTVAVARIVGDPHRCERSRLASAEAELGAPTEDHAGRDVVPTTNRCGADTRLLSFHHDRELVGVGETAPVGAVITRRISWR